MKRAYLVCFALLALFALPARGNDGVSESKISVNLENVPLRQALETVFNAMGADFSIIGGDDANVKRYVSLRLNNVPPEQALEVLARSQPFKFEKVDGKYRIEITPPSGMSSGFSKNWADTLAGAKPGSGGLTMSLGKMTVAEAMRRICGDDSSDEDCGWTLEGGAGQYEMSGVRFYQFPKEQAVKFMLAAADLEATASRIVKPRKSDVRIQDVIEWSPDMLIGIPKELKIGKGDDKVGGVEGGMGSGEFRFRLAAPMMMIGGFGSDALSIAARYDTKSKQWLYTMFASQARDTTVLERLLSLSGAGYVMADWTERSGAASVSAMAALQKRAEMVRTGLMPELELLESMDAIKGKSRLVSTQLYDVTLEEALDTLTSSVGLVYRKKGSPANPTYIIEQGTAEPKPAAPQGVKPKK